MLFAVSGPQGCGKSTVLNELKTRGFNVIERKTARSILEDWNTNLDVIYADHTLHMKFQDEILKRKIEDENNLPQGETFFTERSFADLFVYTSQNLSKYNECNDWLNEYYSKCCKAQQNYADVFYIPGGKFEAVDDGVRGINKHYSIMIDCMLKHYLDKMSKVVTVTKPDIAGRADLIQTRVVKTTASC